MNEQHWFRKHWKLVLNVVTIVALAVLIFAIRGELASTFSNLGKVNAWALLLIIPIEALNYHAQAKLYQHLFGMVGNKLSYKFLYRAALELNFVNHVFPSGGVTGLSFFSLRMRGEKLTASKATLIHVIKLVLTFVSFEVLILFGLLSLSAMGRVSNLTILVAAVISTLLIVGTALFAYIVGSRRRINDFFTAMTRGLNRLIHVVRPRYPETINIDRARGAFDEFHDNYQVIKKDIRRLKAPFWYALLANVTEVMAVYVVYIAFDEYVNIGAVILAYAVANFAGLVSVLPGGVGIYEALMTAVLISAGVPAAVSIPVTIMYRVLNTLVQVPIGFYFYQKTLHQNGNPEAASSETPHGT
ncbi:MAG: hypothetical protein JWL89_50 [Candidatus Saccharibacteria bacterium]|nr:hypothetical protein [Candidatus Saccharibacteria bacterium]